MEQWIALAGVAPVPQKRVPLFDTTEDQTLRIQTDLACKIGFNEAVILMQLEYLITIANHERESKVWTYQSLTDLKDKYFPWWSIATISRGIKSLEEQKIIFVDSFNKRQGDKTQWFSLNFEAIEALGVKLNRNHPILQNEKWVGEEKEEPPNVPIEASETPPHFSKRKMVLQDETPIFQFETTLPETPPEILSPNGDSDQKPPEDSEKWNNTNKKIVGDKFLELTQIKPPPPKSKAVGAWWGWLFEIFEMSGKDSTETCRVMGIVVSYMRHKRIDILSPKSLINYSRVVASGQELNGTGSYGQAAPRASPKAPAFTPEQLETIKRIRESERQQ